MLTANASRVCVAMRIRHRQLLRIAAGISALQRSLRILPLADSCSTRRPNIGGAPICGSSARERPPPDGLVEIKVARIAQRVSLRDGCRRRRGPLPIAAAIID